MLEMLENRMGRLDERLGVNLCHSSSSHATPFAWDKVILE